MLVEQLWDSGLPILRADLSVDGWSALWLES